MVLIVIALLHNVSGYIARLLVLPSLCGSTRSPAAPLRSR